MNRREFLMACVAATGLVAMPVSGRGPEKLPAFEELNPAQAERQRFAMELIEEMDFLLS